MSVETTKDIINHSRMLHQRLADTFQNMSHAKEISPRKQMLLEYLTRHESNLQQALEKYEEDAKDKVLNTWFQFSPSEDIKGLMSQSMVSVEGFSTDDMLSLALTWDDYIIKLYQELIHETNNDEVKEVFENLLKMEEEERRNLVRNATLLEDL